MNWIIKSQYVEDIDVRWSPKCGFFIYIRRWKYKFLFSRFTEPLIYWKSWSISWTWSSDLLSVFYAFHVGLIGILKLANWGKCFHTTKRIRLECCKINNRISAVKIIHGWDFNFNICRRNVVVSSQQNVLYTVHTSFDAISRIRKKHLRPCICGRFAFYREKRPWLDYSGYNTNSAANAATTTTEFGHEFRYVRGRMGRSMIMIPSLIMNHSFA